MSQTVVIVQVVQPDFFSVGSRAAAAADGPAAILLKEGAEHPCPGRVSVNCTLLSTDLVSLNIRYVYLLILFSSMKIHPEIPIHNTT